MLTVEECRVAADRAEKYPLGYGMSMLALTVPGKQFDDFGTSVLWLKEHPEDLEKG
jgi:hypothetical protein